jgi:DNA-binding NtrC family response regulator
VLTKDSDGENFLAGKQVLIVEDETLVAMLLEDMVADLGGLVAGSASRVAQALEILRDSNRHIDLAVLDVNLGGEEAFPVAAALAERGVPFAFSTGYGSGGLPETWRARPVLQKPFTHDQVRAVLARAVAETAAG